MNMDSDSKIWDDFRNGEGYALSHIYYQNVQLLFRYGSKFSNEDELIKDTIQDLFCDLLRTRKKLGKTDNIKFYLVTSFRRKLFKNIKSQLAFTHKDKDLKATIVYSAEQLIIEDDKITQRNKAVKKGLMELTTKQREILFYRFTCDFEYEQICEIMQLKYDSARKQVFRALKSLKKSLSEKDIFVLFFGGFLQK